MSRGNDSRTESHGSHREESKSKAESRSSRSSIAMTAERARAIQAHADRTGSNQDFKARAMSAGEKNEVADESKNQ